MEEYLEEPLTKFLQKSGRISGEMSDEIPAKIIVGNPATIFEEFPAIISGKIPENTLKGFFRINFC